ncbi:MAG: fatty acid desaturase family protein [Pseudomonadales bacterium]|nr:fatty acid desaturase family protein [Pseudomonadales bacterium]
MNATEPTVDAAPVQRARDIFSKEEIRELSRISDVRGALLIAHCWATIFAVWVVCAIWTNPVTILLGIMIVGARQLGLGVISHDAAHHILFRNRKFNDWAAEWFLNRPLMGASVVPYRQYHLVHHRFTQQENDPDLHLSAPFPTTRASMRRKMVRDLTGQTGWKQRSAAIRNIFRGEDGGVDWRKGLVRLGPNIAINMAFLSGFIAAGKPELYVLLWIVPNLTWELLVARIRNIGEHGAVPDNEDRLRNTRTTLANPLERLFIAPYFVNYHLEHHLLVSCPCYRLPAAHRMLKDKGMLPRMEVRRGYLDMLRVAAPA